MVHRRKVPPTAPAKRKRAIPAFKPPVRTKVAKRRRR